MILRRLRSHLQTHKDIQSRPRPYECSDCQKSFLRSSDLWSHQRIHSGSKYTCLECGKRLASSGSLHNHRKSVHEEQKRFECHVCFKLFALKQKLVNHVLSEHEGRVSSVWNTLSMIYKQQRFWATSLKLQWLLILIANFGFDSENITSVVAYFPFQNINVAYFWLVIVA